jgi:NitT/TauT family transport system substrate-binding protein
MKKLVVLIAGLFSLTALYARGKVDAREIVDVTVYGLKGPSGVGMVRLLEDGLTVAGYSVRFELLAQADLMAGRFIAGDAKIGILPPNVPAKIASTGKNLQIAGVTGLGMLSLLTSDTAVTKIEDLRGKRVAVAGQGAVPEFVFRKILAAHGLRPDALTLDFSLAYPEIAQSLITGRVQNALLPEPFATMAMTGNPALRDVAPIEDEWVKAGGPANYPMTALVVDGDWAAGHPRLITALLAAYRYSIEWVTEHPKEAGELAEQHDLGLRAPVVTASIPRSNFVFQNVKEARPSIEALFRAFLEYAPESIGGKLPGDSFYLPETIVQ